MATTTPTPAQLAADMTALMGRWRTYTSQLQAWLGGTVTGGPNGDGMFPLTDSQGNTFLVPCPALEASRVDGEVNSASSFADAAKASADATTTYVTQATLARDAADDFANASKAARDLAQMYADIAGSNAANAKAYSEAAASSASAAAQSASDALASLDTLHDAVTAAKASADAAAGSAQDSAGSAQASAGSASAAADSATAAAGSASAAASSKTAAASSASAAASSKTAAATSATNASNSATAAKTSETNAKTSETNSKASETNAAGSASAASASQGAAASSASAASDSAKAASDSANAAASSQSAASNSAAAASASATAAGNSQTAAKTSETNAASSASAAASSASAAATSATNAKTSETNAKTSETNAASSKTAAATSATNAKTSETNAASSASASANSATAAATFNPALYAKINASAVFSQVAARDSTSNGYVQLISGNDTVAGYLEGRKTDGTRTYYVGWGDTTKDGKAAVNLTADNGMAWQLHSSGVYSDAPFNVSGTLGGFNYFGRDDNQAWSTYVTGNRWRVWTSQTGDVFQIGAGGDAWILNNQGGGSLGIGDDALIKDVNVAHTLGVVSQTNGTYGFIRFGTGPAVGWDGAKLSVGGVPGGPRDDWGTADANALVGGCYGGYLRTGSTSNTPDGNWCSIQNNLEDTASWGYQIAHPWFQDDIYWRRKYNGGFDLGWRKFWHSGNLIVSSGDPGAVDGHIWIQI